jgi:hypothetical protein
LCVIAHARDVGKDSGIFELNDHLQPIPDAVLDIAIRKATEAGLFPRHCSAAEHAANRQTTAAILTAALEIACKCTVASKSGAHSDCGERPAEENLRGE